MKMTEAEPQVTTGKMKTYLTLLLIQFFWGFLAPIAKIAFLHFDPMFVIFLRIGISSLFFYIVYRLIYFKGRTPWKDLLKFAALGFFGVAVSQVSFINGVARTTSINSLIILATIPLNTLIFSVLLKKERFSFLKVFAVLLGFCGVFFIVGLEKITLSGNTVGNLLILLSSASYSLYLVLSKTALKKHEPFKLLTFVFLFGFLEVLPFSFLKVFDMVENPVHIKFWWAPMVVVIVGTLLPNMLTIMALKNVKASVVGVFSYLEPLFGVILSIIILGEQLRTNNIIAAVFILAGVMIASAEEWIMKKLKSVFTPRKTIYEQL